MSDFIAFNTKTESRAEEETRGRSANRAKETRRRRKITVVELGEVERAF